MPYDIIEKDGQYCVVKPDGEAVGCHVTQDEARAQQAALYANEPDASKADMPYYRHNDALKALGDGRIGGYLVAFGLPRDLHGEYFAADTEFNLDWYQQRPVLYHHGLGEAGSTKIGIITSITKDERGLYAEAILDINHEDPTIRSFARRAYDLVTQGKLGWSSGSLPHLVETTNEGKITKWPITEGSVTPTPAEPYRTTVSAIKAQLDTPNDGNTHDTPDAIEPEATPVAANEGIAATRATDDTPNLATGVNTMVTAVTPPKKRAAKMDMAALLAAMNEVSELTPDTKLVLLEKLAAMESGMEAPEEGLAADVTEETVTVPADPETGMMTKAEIARLIQTEIVSAQKRAAPVEVPPATGDENPMPVVQTPRIQMRSKYADLSATELSLMACVQQARYGKGYVPSQEFTGELLAKANKGILDGTLQVEKEIAVKAAAIKADELVNTTFASAAGDWVPTLWTSELWKRTRVDAVAASKIRNIDMPSPSYEVPIESTDPTVYYVQETQNEDQLTLASSNSPIPESKMFAGKVTLTAKKLAIRTGFSVEQDEDSIIAFIPQLREQTQIAALHAIDNVILNGDTETGSTNINYDGSSAPTDAVYLAADGARKLGLVTNTAVQVDLSGGQPTLQQIRGLRSKLQNSLNKYGIYPSQLVMFCDTYTYFKLLNIDELNVYFNNGRGATVNTGEIAMIDGVELYASEDIQLTDTDGKYTASGVGNSYGSLVIMARNAWYLGYRRQITSALDYLSYYDSYMLTTTMRIAVENRDTVSAGVMYGIGV